MYFFADIQDLPRWKSTGDYTIILCSGLVEISDSNHTLVGEFYPTLFWKSSSETLSLWKIFLVDDWICLALTFVAMK